MNRPILSCVLLTVTVCCLDVALSDKLPGFPSFTTKTDSYVTTYDRIDVNRLLKNDKFVSAYIKCFTGEGPCTNEGKQIKAGFLPEIISTVCAKCSPRQKEMARQVLRYVYVTRRPDFDKIMKIYDTQNKRDEIIDFMYKDL